MCNLHSIITVLQLLHVATNLLEGFLLVDLVPVNNPRFYLVKQLEGGREREREREGEGEVERDRERGEGQGEKKGKKGKEGGKNMV